MSCDSCSPKARLSTSPRNGLLVHHHGAKIEKPCWKLLRKLVVNLNKSIKNNYLKFLARLLQKQERPRPQRLPKSSEGALVPNIVTTRSKHEDNFFPN
ncbi:hypothetical protein OMB55_00018040 [gamma proteobacterium HIMB55]|nr:hypothetical protein OMB55_00018040 [gamma proteobacterium HIMB55]